MTNNLDLEARLHGTAHSEHPQELRLWLRLLTCTQLIEKQIRTELRVQFDTTLPRFDLMAQLERNPDGLKMNDLSRRMMVSGGNVTGITDQLVTEGLVERVAVDGDRRSYRVKLTAKGQASFAEMAAQHENWIVEAFSSLKNPEITTLHKLLGQVKQHAMDSKNTMKEDAL
jgi:DNA-binding MarR family transcriptional regulator